MNTEELKAMIDNEPNDVLDALSTEEIAGYYDSSQCDDNTITNDANDTYTYDDTQKWYKSWAVWTSLISLIGLFVVNIFHLIDSEIWNTIVSILLTLLPVFGIANNPTVRGRLS